MIPLFLRKLAVRFGARLPLISQAMNRYYNGLPISGQVRWHQLYRSLDSAMKNSERYWEIAVPGSIGYIKFPLKYWEQMLTLNGYDPELKEWYALRIAGHEFDTFVDVGANYGTHSFLAMHYGMDVVLFEPNIDCFACIRDVCRLNRWYPTIMQAAVGGFPDKVSLFSPKDKSWLGIVGKSRGDAIKQKFASDPQGGPEGETKAYLDFGEAESTDVLQTTLDSYAHVLKKAAFLKIDVEGAELSVLQGASFLLTAISPTVVFESFPCNSYRTKLWEELTEHGYVISSINVPGTLTKAEFLASVFSNFYAIKS